MSEPTRHALSCKHEAWIVFPLFKRCQNCGKIEDTLEGWKWLAHLSRELQSVPEVRKPRVDAALP
jgi:hypothetical protein